MVESSELKGPNMTQIDWKYSIMASLVATAAVSLMVQAPGIVLLGVVAFLLHPRIRERLRNLLME